jgi:hypothetical protein
MAINKSQLDNKLSDEYRVTADENPELAKDFVDIDMEGWDDEKTLTHEQVNLVNQERKNIKENPGQFIDWEKARKTLDLDQD